MQMNVSLQLYLKLRDRFYRACEELVSLAQTIDVAVIIDSSLDSWIVLNADEAASLNYHHQPLAQAISTHAHMLYKPFQVAVMGEFSRGKSTLINALLGKQLLITDFRPNTAVRTTIKTGTKQGIRVHFLSGRDSFFQETDDISQALASVTSDASFEDNQQGLLRGTRVSLAQQYKEVEVYANIPFLREREIELIDTPGLGSVFESHQAVAQSIISSVDMILYVVQYDPGIGAEDIDFLLSAREKKDTIRFLLTKKDRATSVEKLQEYVGFMQDTLREQVGIEYPKIYPVAANFALNGHYSESGIMEAVSGIDEGLVSISGIQRIQDTFKFVTTCTTWLDIALSRQAQHLDKSLQIQERLLDESALQLHQARHLHNALHAYIKSSMVTLANQLKESINELSRDLQFAAEATIDSLEPEAFITLSQRVIRTLQAEVDKWYQRKQKYSKSQANTLLEHICQLVAPFSSERPNQKIELRMQSYPKVFLSAITLFSLFPDTSSGVSNVLTRIGTNVAIKSVRTRHKQFLLEPIVNQHISIYQIAINGINITLAEQERKQIVIDGIRWQLEATFVQMCQSFERQLLATVDATIQPYSSNISQLQERLLQEREAIKQQLVDVATKCTQLETIKHCVLDIEQESKHIVPDSSERVR